jgi:hypothetical protein
MSGKKYRIQTACPQCGCSAVSHLTVEEIREKYGDVPNVEMECRECLLAYQTSMKSACPEWDRECQDRFTK